MDASHFGKVLILTGIVIALLGGLIWSGARLGLGRLPGDMSYQGRVWAVYVPVATCIVISAVLSVLLWLTSRWRD